MEADSAIYFVNSGRRNQDNVRICDRRFTQTVLQYFYEGEVEVEGEDGKWERCKAPGVFITFPGVSWHYGPPPGKTWSHLWIGLTGEGVGRLLNQGLLEFRHRGFFLPVRAPREFHQKVELLMRLGTAEAGSPQAKNAILLLEKVLGMLYREEPRKNQSNPLEKYREALRKLGEGIRLHPERIWDFHRQANHLSISYSIFRKYFRDLFQMPPGQFLQRERLELARRLLKETTLPIGKISLQAGFPEEGHFRRMFRNAYGFSPREYRAFPKD
ncbi:MAG: AraC family transcriptional regulator [Oligosphaeraceae bacterium]